MDDHASGCIAAEQAVQIEVEDNGPGFPADRERLFEPYVTTRAKGTGLGLAIVKKIMEEHGGSVELLAGKAGGALVRLDFPARAQLIAAQGGSNRSAVRVPSGHHSSAGSRPGT